MIGVNWIKYGEVRASEVCALSDSEVLTRV